ncbi:META domain-containing protein [Brevibacterium sp. XM4083]|uniref:META domain-containing protein n=1 Tax=Brevibacterium sp. XM4083 TaxID=2583238 RepID=UPI0011266E13|nr:META domain-containing protein [Brevibacterium sp. XM4083]MCM1014201.1 META domain-containing protein [Brevibacterium sp. XM4083]
MTLDGQWSAGKDSKAFLALAADGTLNGSDGANRIVTTWQSDGDASAVIAPFLTTQMAAPGMKTWLGRVRRVEADGDVLAVFDQSGNRLGELIRDHGGEK